MDREQRSKTLKVVLAAGSLAIIVAGLGVALAGEWFGWLIAAFGVLDAATIPFVLRVMGARSPARGDASPGGQVTAPDAPTADSPAADPTADPSYNPYARED